MQGFGDEIWRLALVRDVGALERAAALLEREAAEAPYDARRARRARRPGGRRARVARRRSGAGAPAPRAGDRAVGRDGVAAPPRSGRRRRRLTSGDREDDLSELLARLEPLVRRAGIREREH